MPSLTVETYINAPVERCFNLARDIGLHCSTASHTGERAIAGVSQGLIGMGETVTFEAKHFGIRQRLTVVITEFESPSRFVDEMTHGAFKSMKHSHEFTPDGAGTLMKDTFSWTSPFGALGVVADRLVLQRHLRNFLIRRGRELKAYAESGYG